MSKEQIIKYILEKFFSKKDRELAKEELEKIVDKLFDLSQSSVIGNERATLIIRKKFGILDNGEPQTFEKIIEELNIDPSTIVQTFLTELAYLGVVFEQTKSLSDGLDKLNLSLRSRNALYNSKIFTIRQITEMDREDLKNIKGLGGKSYNEVLEKIHLLGYSFAGEQNIQSKDKNKSYSKKLKKL